jgi:hypothetical protein
MWSLNGRFERMVRYAKRGHDPDWFGSYTEHEQQAMTIKAFGLALVPGLLQTAEYARALFIAGRISDIEQAITLRMSRQSVLTRDDPPELWVLLAEYVIETPIGGPEVMRGQLERLLNACDSPHVILRVVPKTAGAHVGLDGAFNLVYTPKYKAAYLEAVGGGRLSDDKHEVERFALRFDRIGADALPQDVSRQRIVQAMESMS